jgi:ADP-heptose:LPS heptosyltransferase
MNTLVINLTRFGDLLQSQPVFTELAAMGRKTGLVCLENFAGAAGLLCHVDQIFSLPGGEFYGMWKRTGKRALVRFQNFTAGRETAVFS